MAKRNVKKVKERMISTVNASRAGHTFHERWTARRAMELVFPQDHLKAIAVEGLSTSETAKPGVEAEEVADLVLYYGDGDNFATSDIVQTVQFKYKTMPGMVTASYLRKTIEKFADTILGYEKDFTVADIDKKLSFAFVTNAEFSPDLWEAVNGLKSGTVPSEKEPLEQHNYLAALCKKKKVDAQRLFTRCEFRASEKSLPALNSTIRRTIADWSAGADYRARSRVLELVELVREKAGLRGKGNNLIRREEVLVALDCEPDDLFPADTRFIDVGEIVPRKQLHGVTELIAASSIPIFIHADGGVGKTVFVTSLAAAMSQLYEVVVFDCFGGGAYRSSDQARHLPRVGFVQLTNELASRGLCDPLLPTDADSVALVQAMKRRLTQAVVTLKLQSKKNGLLIFIDAADNAQLEADHRKDAAFPKLLLESLSAEPIDGVKLVFTARTHRMPKVVERSKIAPFALLPFIAEEADSFLSSRRKQISNTEFLTAFSRSRGNARVLAYLVETWDANVAGGANQAEITVEQLIAEKCEKIFTDLHVAGWPAEDVREFFAAISLLPPPIPLPELATALGWPISQVESAASDLAPMLEIVPHGAIFRDEPTETYVRETYSLQIEPQQAIAQRLQEAQVASAYAAEALPSFLVAIKDSDRAYKLANSTEFPSIIQSDFGRRRLMLVRLNAAFKLAVNDGDLDRVLGITMQLAQVAAANSRGDEFIRRSPSLAVILGDRDAYRRLFNDRSGWRGARDARLTIAHAFSNEMDEAEIHCDRAVGWINWNFHLPRDEHGVAHKRSGPDSKDFAAVLFLNILRGEFVSVDRNLCKWNRPFALSIVDEAIKLARQYECTVGIRVLEPLTSFAVTAKSKSFALKISLLTSATGLTSQQRKLLARSLKAMNVKPEASDRYREGVDGGVIYAAFAALVHDSQTSAARILRAETQIRISSFEYGERHGFSKAWMPVLQGCVVAWSKKRAVAIHDLLPRGVEVTRATKAITTEEQLKAYLAALPALKQKHKGRKKSKKAVVESRFNSRECLEIARGIKIVLQIVEPLQSLMLADGNSKRFTEFLASWEQLLPKGVTRQYEEPHQLLCRVIGLGFAKLLLQHTPAVSDADATKLIDLVSDQRFSLGDRTSVLALLASRPATHNRSGAFAQAITQSIRKDDYIEQRGAEYASLAEALLEMSIPEAREYYRNGLSELDKLGSNDYDLIYAILNYAAVQPGGLIRPELGHRLMNLSQTIFAYEPSKFGWTLFAKASAKSVGSTAVTKLVRWGDQEVADFSYGLPQLACRLATEKRLAPRRAAALLTVCEDHGWHDWRLGDGLAELLSLSKNIDEQRSIFDVLFRKLKVEHSSGGWPSVWESLLTLSEEFSELVNEADVTELRKLWSAAEQKRNESNARSSGVAIASIGTQPAEVDPEEFVAAFVAKCDPESPSSIDEALQTIDADPSLPYFTTEHFFNKVRETCIYDKRLGHLFALAEATKLSIDRAIDRIQECVVAWGPSSAHIVAEIRRVIEHLFESKGSQLFSLEYGNVARELSQLTEICGDGKFVLKQVLKTIATERVELDGEEWLQLGSTLCTVASPTAAREALEKLLSGPAAGIADDIGEGPYQSAFHIEDECALISGVMWHLLGHSDAYIRWNTARALSAFVELDLIDELNALLDLFDQKEIPALRSAERYLSFQNSQQWLLMGLARAALIHRKKLLLIKPRLLVLAGRANVHVLHKRHILRCLLNIGIEGGEVASLETEVSVDPKGISEVAGWPKHVEAKSGFRFDYEFNKSEVSQLARVFWIPSGEVVDAIADEIKRVWPEAKTMDFFPGHDRYRGDSSDRYEFYREHVQKHGMLSAATTLREIRPIARQSYDEEVTSPFDVWLNDWDVTFKDGSWLADHKDEVPEVAKAIFLGPRVGDRESIVDTATVLKQLGLASADPDAMLPIYGHWRSPDGVYVRIVSALGARRGIIGRCVEFSKSTDHNLWLPMFWHGGVDDPYRQKSPFDSFIWEEENHSLGVDAGEKTATGGAAARPRLGVDLTAQFGLTADADGREWKAPDNKLALRSQVWGEWIPDPDNHRHRRNEDGEILWASPEWLDQALPALHRQLVYTVTLEKSKSSRSYDNSSGAKAVYVGTRPTSKSIRFWFAKRSSATIY